MKVNSKVTKDGVEYTLKNWLKGDDKGKATVIAKSEGTEAQELKYSKEELAALGFTTKETVTAKPTITVVQRKEKAVPMRFPKSYKMGNGDTCQYLSESDGVAVFKEVNTEREFNLSLEELGDLLDNKLITDFKL